MDNRNEMTELSNYAELQSENRRLQAENKRLRCLLKQHGVILPEAEQLSAAEQGMLSGENASVTMRQDRAVSFFLSRA